MKFGLCADLRSIKQFDNGVIDYCEMALSGIYGLSDNEINEILELSEKTGIKVTHTNGFFPETIKLCGDDFDEKTIKDYSEIALKKANTLGVKTLVLGSGAARKIPEGVEYSYAVAQFIRGTKIAAEICAKYGMTIVIEPLYTPETNMINSVKEGGEIVRKINHPNVKLLCDIFHYAYEKEDVDVLYENKEILKHFHIANPDGRVYPAENDKFDYKRVAKAMKDIGYDLSISIEGRAINNIDEDLPQSIAYLKRIFA